MLVAITYHLLSYLLGSIPTAVGISKWKFGFDIREKGSGNAGATNTFRVLGRQYGLLVLCIDILKAFIPVFFADYVIENLPYWMFFSVGFCVVIGHIFPVFARFKGGKGIACFMGVVLAMFPLPGLLSLATFLLVLMLFNYVSLASMVAGITFTFWLVVSGNDQTINVVFSILLALVVLISHRKNIRRLRDNKESKIYLLKREQ